jgi:hypothetical protein
LNDVDNPDASHALRCRQQEPLDCDAGVPFRARSSEPSRLTEIQVKIWSLSFMGPLKAARVANGRYPVHFDRIVRCRTPKMPDPRGIPEVEGHTAVAQHRLAFKMKQYLKSVRVAMGSGGRCVLV